MYLITDSPENRPETAFASVFVRRFLGVFGSLVCWRNYKSVVLIVWCHGKVFLFSKPQQPSSWSLQKHKGLFSIHVRSLKNRMLMISVKVYNFTASSSRAKIANNRTISAFLSGLKLVKMGENRAISFIFQLIPFCSPFCSQIGENSQTSSI